MNNKGFTLVELLAVIIIMGILFSIAIPSTVSISSKVKQRSYSTKVSLIEEGAESYGQSNINALKNSETFCCDKKNASGYTTYVDFEANFKKTTGVTSCDEVYPCKTVTIENLISTSNLDSDETVTYNDGSGAKRWGLSINPVNNRVINYCRIFVYYKYKRVYAFFDQDTCDNKATAITEAQTKYYSFEKSLTGN